MRTKHLYTFLLIMCPTIYAQAATWYVKTGGTGGATSWATANGDLQAVINIATAGDDIYIAAGTYIPNRKADSTDIIAINNRDNAFVFKNGIDIYGGFPSSGDPIFTDRNPALYPTVLSGDFNGDDVITGAGNTLAITGNSENAYHVILLAGNDSTTRMDGLSIKGGNANNDSTSITVSGLNFLNVYGGGMICNSAAPRINNCSFSGNNAAYGGAMLNTSNASPVISNSGFFSNYAYGGLGGAISNENGAIGLINCDFTGNYCISYGGAICNVSNSFRATGCKFSNNASSAGGALYNENVTPFFVDNCRFINNNAFYNGGGMHNRYCPNAIISRCFFSGNNTQTNSGGGLENTFSNVQVNHCVFTGNTGVNQSGDGGGAIDNVTSTAKISNCSFSGNNVSNFSTSTAIINNSILWGTGTTVYNDSLSGTNTASVNYSIVQGGYAGTGNINADPHYLNAANPAGADSIYGTADDGLTLTGCSPALNSGNNDSIPAGSTTDITGSPVIYNNGIVDRGAYEYQAPISTDPVLYVDSAIAVSGAGTTWATAFKTLQEALNVVQSCGSRQIWVKKGTYYPTAVPAYSTGATGSRNYTFMLRDSLAIYGGFPLTANPVFTDRNATAYPTVLSGDFNNDDVVAGSGSTISITGNDENAYHVVVSVYNLNTALIDGFTIKGGNASDTGHITYTTQALANQNGGGMYIEHFSIPVVSNCIFLNNEALNYGGGMYNYNAAPAVINCTFSNNRAQNLGGGMLNDTASAFVTNCVFFGNNGGNGGGGMENANASPVITNSTFSGNYATEGGGLFNYNSPVTINNCILWGNTATGTAGIFNSSSIPLVNYSLVQGGYSGTGNLNADPLFFNAANPAGADGKFGTLDDGLILQSGSPAINTGSDSLVPQGINTDITGSPRLTGNVDMGAYESSAPLPLALISFTAQLSGKDALVSWATASEHKTNYFEIYYSTDGKSFIRAGQVNAAGNSNGLRKYSFIHDDVVSLSVPVLYYKLKQTDQDKAFTYSKTVTLRLPETATGIQLYPNPIIRGDILTIEAKDIKQLSLFNTYGQQIWTSNYDSRQMVWIPTKQLAKGTYYLNINGAQTRKIIVL